MPKIYFSIHHIKYNGETTLLNNPLKVEIPHDFDLLQSLKHCLFSHKILPDCDLQSVTFTKNGHFLMNDDIPSNGATYEVEVRDEKDVCLDCLVVLNIEDPVNHGYRFQKVTLSRNSTFHDLLQTLTTQKILKSVKHVSIFQNDNEKIFNLSEKCKDRGFYSVSSKNICSVMFNIVFDKNQRFSLLYDSPSTSNAVGQALDSTVEKYLPNIGVYNVEKLVKRKNNNTTQCSVVDKVAHEAVYEVWMVKAKVTCHCQIWLNDRFHKEISVTLDQNTSLSQLPAHIPMDGNVKISKIQYYSEIFDEFVDYFPQVDELFVYNNGRYCLQFTGAVESLHDVS
ncbi:unnamed protein product [Bursaphelenchus xylophilus]|uniref:(pine wood nematode) hypothetical protein n=1 Tax=Bursaphelenchus xylophilus TaxID=6326 RepID=A0A1I7SCB7_BURXY|nr:unnamed protein product [Bursaphelenchus xylophilus]CAG9094404.1 unnamed protein product [Bursaphelenchus xylophilus]